jgi:hypothetical protein
MPGTEQAAQRLDLSVTRVLVLVEQHRRESFSLDRRHLGKPGESRCERHLVAEIHCRQRRLGCRELAHEGQQGVPMLQRGDESGGVSRPLAACSGTGREGIERVECRPTEPLHLIDVDQVVGELPAHREYVLRHGRRSADRSRQVTAVVA